jgi:hypothetical protein
MEPYRLSICLGWMKSTEKKARRGMTRFVAIIFAIAVALAAVYFLAFTPGTA